MPAKRLSGTLALGDHDASEHHGDDPRQVVAKRGELITAEKCRCADRRECAGATYFSARST